jgi:hypothetical protein
MALIYKVLLVFALIPSYAVNADSNTAIDATYLERCLNSIESEYYSCECLAQKYKQKKTENPALSDYAFVQGDAYEQCFDAEVAKKTATKNCESMNVPIFDCDCAGKAYITKMEEAGVPLYGSQQEKVFRVEVLTECKTLP